jgi:hypothetical protein
MNLKIASLIINDLRILRLQGFKARKRFRRILTPALLPALAGRGSRGSVRTSLQNDFRADAFIREDLQQHRVRHAAVHE